MSHIGPRQFGVQGGARGRHLTARPSSGLKTESAADSATLQSPANTRCCAGPCGKDAEATSCGSRSGRPCAPPTNLPPHRRLSPAKCKTARRDTASAAGLRSAGKRRARTGLNAVVQQEAWPGLSGPTDRPHGWRHPASPCGQESSRTAVFCERMCYLVISREVAGAEHARKPVSINTKRLRASVPEVGDDGQG